MIAPEIRTQLDDLAELLEWSPVEKYFVERLVAEAAHNASCTTAHACRMIAADMLVEQRSRMHRKLREDRCAN